MKSAIAILASLVCLSHVSAQDHYRLDFLTVLDRAPSAASLEAAYRFTSCKDNSCKDFNAAKTLLNAATKELGGLQAANSMSVVPGGKPSMSPEEAKKLSEKVKNMSKEEKMKWAMENANAYSPGTASANRDMNNPVVTDAVKYVSDEQRAEGFDVREASRADSVLRAVDEKYKPRRDALLKTFHTESHTQYNPDSRVPYAFGEATDQEVKRFDRALAAYKKDVIPLLTNEMNEKLTWLSMQKQALTGRYRMTEAKIAATHYIDDARETVNRSQLLIAHTKVLRKVTEILNLYERVLQEYSKLYAAIMKVEEGNK